MLRRATALFEAVFTPQDSCIVVAQDWPGDDKPLCGLGHLSPLFDFARRQSVGLDTPPGQVEVQEVDEPEIGPHTLTWVEQSARAFRYELIFEGIANADHARGPAISGRVYFVNTLTNAIMHMYDDRGLDIIARRKDTLHSLYRDFDAWILDYDRARIDETFSLEPHTGTCEMQFRYHQPRRRRRGRLQPDVVEGNPTYRPLQFKIRLQLRGYNYVDMND